MNCMDRQRLLPDANFRRRARSVLQCGCRGPNAGKIRLSLNGSWSQCAQIRCAIWLLRDARSRIVKPLGRDWRRQEQRETQSYSYGFGKPKAHTVAKILT